MSQVAIIYPQEEYRKSLAKISGKPKKWPRTLRDSLSMMTLWRYVPFYILVVPVCLTLRTQFSGYDEWTMYLNRTLWKHFQSKVD